MPEPLPRSRLFRLLLRLYPSEYRARYGREMELLFEEERRASDGGGLVFLGQIVLDHIQASMAVRLAKGREGRMGMEMLVEDFKNGLRTLRRAPTFVLFATMTLALGIGATTAVFTVLDRIALRPLPYEDANRMARVGARFRHAPDEVGVSSPAMLAALIEAPGPAESVVGVAGGGAIFVGRGDPVRVGLSLVSADYFRFFGARPAVGRLLSESDHMPGAPPVVALGHGFWRQRFGGDPAVVGSTIRLDDQPYTVVGVVEAGPVAPQGFMGGGDVWLPVDPRGERASGSFFVNIVARLRPGATLKELDDHARRIVAEVYGDGGPIFVTGAGAVDLRRYVVGDIGSTLGHALAAVVLLLLIACANVSSLLLARAAERSREFAVRAALGAGQRRLVRQLLAESSLLAVTGGMGGATLAFGGVALFRRYAPEGLPRIGEAAVDVRSLAFAFGVSLVTVLIFGLLPAVRGARQGSLAGSARLARGASASREEGRIRGVFVLIQTALSVVLVIGAGLVTHDLLRVAGEDPGFRTDGLIGMVVDLDGRPAGDERAAAEPFWTELLEGAGGLPGVETAALASEIPYGPPGIVSIFTPEGHEELEGGALVPVVPFLGDYSGVMGMRMVDGRWLSPAEMDGSAAVAVVNEAFARTYWPGEAPVGRYVKSGAPGIDDEGGYDVVGVVADVRSRPGVDATPQLFVPFAAEPRDHLELVVRTKGDPARIAPALRALVRRLDPGLPIMEVRTVASLSRDALGRSRFYTGLFSAFALIALALALVGVYGTTAYATRLRTREIGIRRVLGAGRSSVVGRVIVHSAGVVGLGVAVGLVVAALGSRVLSELLVTIDPGDLQTYTVVGVFVFLAGVFAAWLPAHRASCVDLLDTLREEG